MTDDLGLDSLLKALRGAGLRIGVGEVARLRRVFDLGPAGAGRARLESLLRAVLVKSGRDRRIFDRVFAAWLERAESWRPAPESDRKPVTVTAARWRPLVPRRRTVALATVAVTLLATSAGLYWWRTRPLIDRPAPPPTAPPPPAQPTTVTTPRTLTPDEVRQRKAMFWVPTLTVEPGKPVWTGQLPLALAIISLAAGCGLWLALRRRRWLPEPAPPPAVKGPPRAFLEPPDLEGARLLPPKQREDLVWGIGRFTAEESTRKLDVPATVKATARAAGLPELHFERARYHREVWLWIDEAAGVPEILQLAAEVEMALAAHGLPVERATFRGVPDRLTTAAGKVFAPREIDERRGAALVAILTDGRRLARWTAGGRRRAVDAVLRDLGHWPRLAFADFSGGVTGLAPLLRRHGIELVDPGQLAAFLGGGDAAGSPETGATGRLETAWAAACALAPGSIDEATALALRSRLGLPPAPWALPALRAEAGASAGRLAWPRRLRAHRLNWLWAAEAGDAGSGLAGRALGFFKDLYDAELERREDDTPARQHLKMERALIRLWHRAGDAVSELYRLHSGALREPIHDHMAALAVAGAGGAESIAMPWRWNDRSPAEQVMLQQMGFGGVETPANLRRPGRLWLGLGLCAGLTATAMTVAIRSFESMAEKPLVVHENPPPEAPLELVEPMDDGRWRVSVATRKWSAFSEAAPGSQVRARWSVEECGCVEQLESGVEIWRCGGVESPPRLSGEISNSQALLKAALREEGAEKLAVALLDSGSADTVLIRENPDLHMSWARFGIASDRSDWQVIELGVDSRASTDDGAAVLSSTSSSSVVLGLQAALLVIENKVSSSRIGLALASDWGTLEEALEFEGVRALAEVWNDPDRSMFSNVVARRSAPVLRGLRTCSPIEETDDNGIVFVRVCPGTFMMGSPEDEEGRWDGEGPQHQVTVNEFSIGKYEITNKIYQRFQGQPPSHYLDEGENLPVESVTWFEADKFCRDLGYSLPTEAEWEYAARADTDTRWSFGEDDRETERYAWYADNADSKPHPVGEKESNAWGIHDMHGNVYEWVADWYGRYSEDPQIDPTGPDDGSDRAFRGGAFFESPWNLRSAYRFGGVPEVRSRNIGFRCVRSPRRQP